jgi:hypothetical protein
VTGRDIVDALQKGRIEVKTMGSGIETVTLGIKRLVNHPVRVVIPVGTFFVCHGSAQSMVGRREKTIVLSNNDWQTLTVDATCANRSKAIPGNDDIFDIQLSPHQEELKRLMPILEKAGVSFNVEQAAV